MVKKIRADQLKPGMYIHDLNCGWMEHPFLGSSLNVKDRTTVNEIIKLGIREVFIDTEKGIDVGVVDEIEKEVEVQEVEELPESGEPVEVNDIGFRDIQPVPLGKEILKAKKIKKQAMRTVQEAMNDIKAGKQIERDKVEGTVDEIIVSVFRNQDALTGLGRLRKVDEYLYNHSISVCMLMVSFGKYLGLDQQMLREVGIGALLHDIGAMKVSPEVLNKKSALTDEEFEEMKKHVENTRTVLEGTEGMTEVSIQAACEHHERLDGSGYPKGLREKDISHLGQAIAIVDVYDTLSTKRCYSRRIPPTQALQLIYERSGDQFNRELVQKFIRCVGIYPVGAMVRLTSGLVGIVVSHHAEKLLQPVIRVVYNARTDRYISVPYDIDLSQQAGNDEVIISYEIQEHWNIQPEMYL